MVHFVDILLLSPQASGLIHKDEIFILVVNHLGNIVEVGVLEEHQNDTHIGSMERSSEGTLATVLEIHIVVVITITYLFKTQTRAILELLWDRPPVEIVTLPRK